MEPKHPDPEQLTATVVNVQHFSTHDGPGIRTTVFLKGCSLRCAWCCNPETISPGPELGFNPARCIGVADCGRCLTACPEQALQARAEDGRVRVEWERCTDCLRCVGHCPSEALQRFGVTMSVADVLAEVEQDAAFYSTSGGGITLSGGECLQQPAFCAAVLKEARARGLHTAIETAGNVPWSAMAQVLPYVDTMLHDYKLIDPAAHKHWTGARNDQILANYRRAYREFPGVRYVARMPLVPGVNDDEAHVDAVLDAIEPYANVAELELLPYHGLGTGKYGALGRSAGLQTFTTPAPDRVAGLRRRIAERLEARARQRLAPAV